MAWAESRVRLAENAIELLKRRLRDDEEQIRANAQAIKSANQANPAAGAQGGGGGIFVCMAPAAVAATWSGSLPQAPGAFQAEVYQCTGSTVQDMGMQTVYNWMPAATVGGKACVLGVDSQGKYVVLSQSCV